MEQTVSPIGIQMLKGIKETLDPKNIFGSNNLIDLTSEGGSGSAGAAGH